MEMCSFQNRIWMTSFLKQNKVDYIRHYTHEILNKYLGFITNYYTRLIFRLLVRIIGKKYTNQGYIFLLSYS